MRTAGRTLLVASNFPPVRGGAGVVYANLARSADGAVVVLAPTRNYVDGLPIIGWREHDRRAPYIVRRLPLLRNRMRAPAGRVARLAARIDDLLIRIRLLWTVLALCRRYGCGTVCVGELVASAWLLGVLRAVPWLRSAVYVHGEEITTRNDYDPDFAKRGAALRHAETIFVVSRFTRALLAAQLPPAANRRVVLIENGVDLDRFGPGQRDPRLVADYGIAGRFVFVTVCRLLEKKGIDHALRAFAMLYARDRGLHFLIVGEGAYAGALHALVAALGIGAGVTFAGAVDEADLAAHYRLGDVFVMPNRALADGDTEGFGLVFLEANACGLPVVAGRDGGSVDAVTDGVNGLVVDGGSVDAIAAAMGRLRADPDLRAAIAARGLATAAGSGWPAKARLFAGACLARAAADPRSDPAALRPHRRGT